MNVDDTGGGTVDNTGGGTGASADDGVGARRGIETALADVRQAAVTYDGALELRAGDITDPLAAEVWLFDEELTQVLLVHHRWRGWVAPGGTVEPGETPREAAARELFEETGVRTDLLPGSAAATVRSYRAGWSATLGLAYAAVVDRTTPLTPEPGQPVAWWSLDEPWEGWFAEDRHRMRRHVERLGQDRSAAGRTIRLGSAGPRPTAR